MTHVRTGEVKRELVSKTAFLYLSMMVSALVSYAGLFIAVRYVGELQYGVVAFALSFEGVLLFLTDMGLARSHTKKVSEGADQAKCISVFLFFRLILSATYSVVVLASIFLWRYLFNTDGIDNETQNVLLILLAYNILVSVRWAFVYTFYARRDVLKAQIVHLAEGTVRAFAIVAVVFIAPTASGLAWAFTLSAVASCAYAVFLSRGDLGGVSLLRLDKVLRKEYVTFAVPIAFSIVVGTIAIYLDKVIIQWSSTAIETGSYFASQRLLALYVSLGSAVSVMLFPTISEINGKNRDSAMVGSMTSAVLRYLVFAVIPLMFFMALFSETMIAVLLSPDMVFASTAFSILAVTYGLYILTSPFFSQALGLGYAAEYATYNVIYGVMVITLDVILIPEELFGIPLAGLGIEGAALALLIAQVINSAMFYSHGRGLAGFTIPKGVLRTVAASALSCGAVYLIATQLSMNLLVELAIIFPVYIASTVLMLIVLKALTLSEIREMSRFVIQFGAK